MKLTKITPRGFCKGVVDAWVICKQAAKLYPDKNKYMVGWLVHNSEMVKEMEKLKITTIDDKNTTRSNIIDSIDNPKDSVLIFSAHGTDPKIIKKAKEKGCIVFDATCKYVTKTHDLIQEKLNEDYQILFIGVKNHPETISALSFSDKIILLENKDDVKKLNLNKNEKIFVTNQTTISIYDFEEVIDELKKTFTNIEFKNDICNATKDRQDAIINLENDVDLLLVVGDTRSNNSKKLVEIGKKKGVESYLISSSKEIKDEWFKNKHHVALTSGCSTPTWLTNYVIISLEKKLKIDNEC